MFMPKNCVTLTWVFPTVVQLVGFYDRSTCLFCMSITWSSYVELPNPGFSTCDYLVCLSDLLDNCMWLASVEYVACLLFYAKCDFAYFPHVWFSLHPTSLPTLMSVPNNYVTLTYVFLLFINFLTLMINLLDLCVLIAWSSCVEFPKSGFWSMQLMCACLWTTKII